MGHSVVRVGVRRRCLTFAVCLTSVASLPSSWRHTKQQTAISADEMRVRHQLVDTLKKHLEDAEDRDKRGFTGSRDEIFSHLMPGGMNMGMFAVEFAARRGVP